MFNKENAIIDRIKSSIKNLNLLINEQALKINNLIRYKYTLK